MAVSDDAGKLTYAEVDAASNRVARALVARGVRPGDHVGILLERGAPVVAAMLGVVKAGAAYLSVDTAYPEGRRDLMLGHAGVRVVVSDEAHSGEVGGGRSVVVWERDCVGGGQAEAAPVARPAWPASPACILFTSGSTGEPKGIV